jgi:hypothetical protein
MFMGYGRNSMIISTESGFGHLSRKPQCALADQLESIEHQEKHQAHIKSPTAKSMKVPSIVSIKWRVTPPSRKQLAARLTLLKP